MIGVKSEQGLDGLCFFCVDNKLLAGTVRGNRLEAGRGLA